MDRARHLAIVLHTLRQIKAKAQKPAGGDKNQTS
jgi:hypothetical protein